LTVLTRHEFYKLTERCRDYAAELALCDQTRVNLQQCHQFNLWLPQLKAYDRLAQPLQTLRPARPIARWQLLTIAVVLGIILFNLLPPTTTRLGRNSFFSGYVVLLFLLYFLPERLYGTTVELIEGKVLRIVDVMEGLLIHGELGFTEAAFFQAKTNLEMARRELRQQIDLAHR
jgi:hypothetical protein